MQIPIICLNWYRYKGEKLAISPNFRLFTIAFTYPIFISNWYWYRYKFSDLYHTDRDTDTCYWCSYCHMVSWWHIISDGCMILHNIAHASISMYFMYLVSFIMLHMFYMVVNQLWICLNIVAYYGWICCLCLHAIVYSWK